MSVMSDILTGKAAPTPIEDKPVGSPSELARSEVAVEPPVDQPIAQTMGDVVDNMFRDKVISADDLEKEKKRERARAVISAVGDGVSALANVYGASKGAKSVTPSATLSERNAARYREILNRRRKVQDAWDGARLDASIQDGQNKLRRGLQRQQMEAERLRDAEKRSYNVAMEANKQDREDARTKAKNEFAYKENELKRASNERIASIRSAASVESAKIRGEKASEKKKEKESKVSVIDDGGNIKSIDPKLISSSEYWKYAKNALVNAGVLQEYDGMDKVFKVMKEDSVYEKYGMLNELKQKVSPSVFGGKSTGRKRVDGFGSGSGKKKIEGF